MEESVTAKPQLLESGPDSQTLAVQSAAILLGGLIAVGIEFRVLVMREHWILPLALAASYVFLVFLTTGLRGGRKLNSARVIVQGKRTKMRLRPAPDYLSQRVSEVATSMGITQAISIHVIERTHTLLDGYAVGSSRHPALVFSGGVSLLALRQDMTSKAKFEILVRHELAHLVRDDPETFDTIAATGSVAAVFVLLKIALISFIGFDRAATWYRIIFPRSFSTDHQQSALGTVSVSSYAIFGTLLTTSILLGLLLQTLRWIWVRKREFWADNIALSSVEDRKSCMSAFELLLGERKLKRQLKTDVMEKGFWHPSVKKRLRALTKPLPPAGYYIGSGALFVVATIFAARYILGNNTGEGMPHASRSDIVVGLSMGYFILSVALIDWLVTPIRGTTFGRALVNFLRLLAAIWTVTAIVCCFDATWTMITSKTAIFASSKFADLIARELMERLAMVVGIGGALTVFALASVATQKLTRKVGFFINFAASAAILLLLSHTIGGAFIYRLRSTLVGSPLGETSALPMTTEDDQCNLRSELAGPLAGVIASLKGGYYPFTPPFDCFLLERGPRPAVVWKDETATGLRLLVRERLRNWYDAYHLKHPEFTMLDYSLMAAFAELLYEEEFDYYQRTFPKRKQNPLTDLFTRASPSEEQKNLLNIALCRSVRSENPNAVRLALALGADPNYFVTTERGSVGAVDEVASKLDFKNLTPCARRCLQYLLEAGANVNQADLFNRIERSNDELTRRLIQSRPGGLNPKNAPTSPKPLVKSSEIRPLDRSNSIDKMLARLKRGMTPTEVHEVLGPPSNSPELSLLNNVYKKTGMKDPKFSNFLAEEYVGSDGRLSLLYMNNKLRDVTKRPPK